MEQASEMKTVVKLKITTRGRVVIGVILTILLLTAWAIMSIFAAAKADAYGEAEALGAITTFEYVVVAPGDTMWDIATRVSPQSDPRDVIDDLLRFNQLPGADLYSGQELAIPSKYSN